MIPQLKARYAWPLGISIVIAYELLCDEHELLSRGMDRARATHPVIRMAIDAGLVFTLLHLTRSYPDRYQHLDPYAIAKTIQEAMK